MSANISNRPMCGNTPHVRTVGDVGPYKKAIRHRAGRRTTSLRELSRPLRDNDAPPCSTLCSHSPRLPLEGKLPTESGDEVVTWQKLSSAANTSSTAKAVCARAHQGSPV